MHVMEDPRAGDVLPFEDAATADNRCEIAYDVSESKDDEEAGRRLGIKTEESVESTFSHLDTHVHTESHTPSAAGGTPPILPAAFAEQQAAFAEQHTSSLEEAVLMLPGVVAGENARSYKRKVEFQAYNNHESHAKNLDAYQSRDPILVEQHQGQAVSSANKSNVLEDYGLKVTQDVSGPSSGDSEDEEPIVAKKTNRRRSMIFSAVEMTAVMRRPASILITEEKRLERNNRPKAVTELRRVHFRVPRAKRSLRLLAPVDRSVAAVQYWRMALLVPVAVEIWAFPFRLAYCDIERNEAMFVYSMDIFCDMWFGISMIGYLCDRARCESCLL